MVDRTLADALVEDLGNQLGIEGLVFDDDGQLSLVVGDSTEVILVFDDQTGDIVLSADLGQLEPEGGNEPSGQLLLTLLSANLYWQGTSGGTIGYNPNESQFVLAQRVNVQDCSASNMASLFDTFAHTAEQWTTMIAQDETQEPNETSSSAAFELRV